VPVPLPLPAPVRDPALRALFDPASIAIVGASNDPSKYGNWISVQALSASGDRAVHLVNRRGEPVLGRATHPSLADVPGPVDLVVIAVPAAAFEAAVDDALAAGARAIVGITAGFAELGAAGAEREAALVSRVREAGAVLLGPNCLGVLDSSTDLRLTSNAMPAGPIALVSQSGNLALELSAFLGARDLGLSRFASLGNQADLTAADLIDACAEHPATEMIAVYCEDFRDGRRFAESAARAVASGRPVALLTVGSSEAAVRGARSHTGALTSDAAVVRAACEAAGVDLVATPRELADLLAALRAGRRPRGPRVAVVADGGGHASLASDVSEARGLEVRSFPAPTEAALRALLPPSAATSNPIDLAGAGERDIASFAQVLEVVLDAPSIDAALLTGYFGGYGGYGDALGAAEIATAERMAAIAAERGKPLLVHTMAADSAAGAVLRERGVPVFRAVEDAARSLALLAAPGRRAQHAVPRLPAPRPAPSDDGYWTARELLREAGVAFPDGRRVATAGEAASAALAIGFPVVLKALGLLHKSDAGGVALGLGSPKAVRDAFAAMDERLHAPGYVVERMAEMRDGVELIVGVQRDPRFGPIAMVGLGGVLAEVLHDVAFALAPVDEPTARRLLERLAAAPLLHGVRGRPAIDLGAAAAVVATVSEIAAARPGLSSLEVNPVLAGPSGVLALDARVVLDPEPSLKRS
jgi:acyl-CoA synthetase (NDP forming)